MRLNLGRKGDYSVRAVLDLGRHYGNGRRKAREIAAAMRIPGRSAPQILGKLVRSGLVTAIAGRHGGYELSRAPSQIRLSDVVEAAEGSVGLRQCILRGTPCHSGGTCAVHDAWSSAQEALMRQLRRITIAQLVREESASIPRQSPKKRSRRKS